ncbi:MAG: RluA family pseudouridine synthase [Alphaproteobacteria bacterium]
MGAGVSRRQVAPDEGGLRLDRWFRRHYPDLPHGRLERLLRKGEVRVSGARAKAGTRLAVGDEVRVPPLEAPRAAAPPKAPPPPVADADAEALRAAVLYRDRDVIALDKPPGLAVQGGSKTRRHLDAMLDALRFDATDRPRLGHRLDKDTSGVLLLARNAAAAAKLAAAFRRRETRKIYWALVSGLPQPPAGRIDLALEKQRGAGGERVVAAAETGRRAITEFFTLETAGDKVAWLALRPLTGRTHQLRAHCAALGTPILGDGKYGGRDAFPEANLARKLHLHARTLEIARPGGRGVLQFTAPLPAHMRESWAFLGFDPDRAEDPFAEE